MSMEDKICKQESIQINRLKKKRSGNNLGAPVQTNEIVLGQSLMRLWKFRKKAIQIFQWLIYIGHSESNAYYLFSLKIYQRAQ